MGGTHSSASATATATIINNYAQNFSANCSTDSSGNNSFIVTGNGNTVQNIIQSSSSSSDAKCSVYNPQSVSSVATLSAAIQASSSSVSQQFTGFLDDTSSDANTTIHSTIANTINQQTVFNCGVSANSTNLVVVDGSGNTVNSVDQTSTVNVISNCLMQSSQSASVVANITQAAASTSTATTQSWMQPFVTMFESIMVDGIIALVAFVIFVVLIVLVYKMMEKKPSSTVSAITATPANKS